MAREEKENRGTNLKVRKMVGLTHLFWQNLEREKQPIVSTGFDKIDEETGGFLPQEYWIIGGDARIGKTSLALNFALSVAKQGKNTLYCITEMSNLRLIQKIIGIVANINTKKLWDKERLLKKEIDGLFTTTKAMEKLPLYTIAGQSFSARAISNLITLAEERKLIFEVVFVDYIQQLLEAQGQDWFAGLQMASFTLQTMAKEKNICLVALSQISKLGQKAIVRGELDVWALKGSSAMSQNADVVLLLERKYADIKQKEQLRIKIDKARYGESGISFDAFFNLKTGEIKEERYEGKRTS